MLRILKGGPEDGYLIREIRRRMISRSADVPRLVERMVKAGLVQRLATVPLRSLADARGALVRSKDLLNKTIQLRLDACTIKIGHRQKLIDMASPQNVLKRGFSVTRGQDGKALRSVDIIKPGQVIQTELADGHIKSIVEGSNA